MNNQPKSTFQFKSTAQLELQAVSADLVSYRGRKAVRLMEPEEATGADSTIAIIPDSNFKDGVLETVIAGAPRADAPKDARGFVGIAFHIQPGAAQYECFYLRPTNGRADDQLRRNHATQYISHPDYPWQRLREENPGVYESYADLVPGAWTNVRIVVSGLRALLYLNKAEQPALIVNDLKLGEQAGQIGLWIGGGTQAYFSTIVVENVASPKVLK